MVHLKVLYGEAKDVTLVNIHVKFYIKKKSMTMLNGGSFIHKLNG